MRKPTKLSLKDRNRLIKKQITGKDRKKPIKGEGRGGKNEENFWQTSKAEKIRLPYQFDLYQNTNETLKEMNKFRGAVNQNKPKLRYLVFDKIRRINSSSALMLAAEIDVWNSKVSNQLSAHHQRWNGEVKALLCEMGFFELLNLPPLENKDSVVKDTIFLKFMSGQKSEGAKAKSLREKIESVIGRELEQKLHLFAGLTEAFTNTNQHAYNIDSLNEYDKWWITASYKKDDKKLIVSMYDRGKSIPDTMKVGTKWKLLRLDEGTLRADSKLIEIAMKTSFEGKATRSTTGETHRGQGLKQLLGFIKNKGKLTIISKKGYCAFMVKGDKLEIVEQKVLQYPLKGTLIEWAIVVS